MRWIFNNNDLELLQKKYRKLLQESERLTGIDTSLANEYYAEACKIMNKLSFIRKSRQLQAGKRFV